MNILSLVGPMQHLIDQNLKRLDIEANVVGFRLIQGDNIFPETLKKFGHDLSMSRGLRRRLELESSRLFKRVDDPSYSELEEHVAGGAFRADDLDGFE